MKSAEEDGEEDHERCRNLIVVGVEEFVSPGAGFPVGPPALAALARPSGPVVPLAAGRRAALARAWTRAKTEHAVAYPTVRHPTYLNGIKHLVPKIVIGNLG